MPPIISDRRKRGLSNSLPIRWRLRAWQLLITVPPLLHVMPVNRLAKRMNAPKPEYAATSNEALARYVDDWLHRFPWPWKWTCLKRATILLALLRRSGNDVQLHIGVKRDASKTFAAHAWLVQNGQPYLEPDASEFASYQVITVFPEAA